MLPRRGLAQPGRHRFLGRHALLQATQVIAEPRSGLELEVLGSGKHLLSNQLGLLGEIQFGRGHSRLLRLEARFSFGNRVVVVGPTRGAHFENRALDGLGRNAVIGIVLGLNCATPFRFVDTLPHRGRDAIGVHDDLAARVARGTPRRLNQAARAAQEAFLVRVENGNEAHFR